MKKRYGSVVAAGLFLFLLFSIILVLTNTFPGVKLSGINPCATATCLPTDPGYPANGFTTTNYNLQGGSVAGSATSLPLNLATCTVNNAAAVYGFCSVYTASGGTLYVPGGAIGDSHQVMYCGIAGCAGNCNIGGPIITACPNSWWYLQDPLNLPLGCVPNIGATGSCADVRGNDLVATTTGALGGVLLTSASPTGDPSCTNPVTGRPSDNAPAGGCWANDWSIIQQAQAQNPACLSGVTECLRWTTSANMTVSVALASVTSWCVNKCNPTNSTQVNAALGPNFACQTCTSDVVKTSGQTWYLYRLITDVLLTINPPNVQPACQGDCTSCVNTPTQWCPDNGQLNNVVSSQFIPELNKVSTVRGARIIFGVSITGLAAQCPAPVNPATCFIGIGGMWLGGQSIQPSGCTSTTASCAISNANTSHYQFPLYTDGTLTTPAIVPTAQDVINLASVTNQTIQQVQQASLPSVVYSYVDVGALGNQYTSGGSQCSVSSLSLCIIDPAPVYLNVPLIYDAIGTYTNFFYTYPGIPPVGGSNGGTISGHVCDSGNKPLLGGSCQGGFAGLAGACVGLGGPCSGYTGQLQAPTDGNGAYSISPGNIPAGIYTVTATAPGYGSLTVPGVKVSTGSSTVIDFYLSSVIPPGQICLIPPVPNPVNPFGGNLFNGLCFPSWILPVALGLSVLLVVAIILTTPAGQALGFGGAALASAGASRIRKQ